MHELPVTEKIYNTAMEQAKKNKACRINSITIRMGEGCDYVPDIIQEYFQLFAEGTIADGAMIKADIIPTRIKCLECGKDYKKDLSMTSCPSCGSPRLRPLISSDLTIESMEMEFE